MPSTISSETGSRSQELPPEPVAVTKEQLQRVTVAYRRLNYAAVTLLSVYLILALITGRVLLFPLELPVVLSIPFITVELVVAILIYRARDSMNQGGGTALGTAALMVIVSLTFPILAVFLPLDSIRVVARYLRAHGVTTRVFE